MGAENPASIAGNSSAPAGQLAILRESVRPSASATALVQDAVSHGYGLFGDIPQLR